jgi:hypothetical protein
MTLEFTEIYPKIFVYKNPWSDIDLVTKTIIESETNPEGSLLSDWNGWYTFGKEVQMLNYDGKPDDERTRREKAVWDEVIDVFYKTTQSYSEHFGVPVERNKTVYNDVEEEEMEVWKRMGPSICKYEINSGIDDTNLDIAMHYHTDYQIEYAEQRGYKFVMTATMYLNDEYEGGGIDFLVGENKLFHYKPSAGDVLVFPAGNPMYLSEPGELYRHGVKKCYGSPKYFIRNHWTKFYEGDKDWLEQEAIYGKEAWNQMEFQRIKQARTDGAYQTLDYDTIFKNAERIQ